MSGTSLAALDAVRRLIDDGRLRTVLLPLIDQDVGSWWARVGALAIAAGIGVVHALGPGHGKVLVGAYLAGSEGRPRDAVALGGLVAAMHTGVVLVLGALFASAGALPGGRTLEAWLGVVAGVAVSAVGAWMVFRHVRGRPGHTHDHDPPHGIAPASRAGVVAIATSGGLLPSPAAFLVLATAIATDRTGFGLALVGAFSVGLAVTLAAVGLATVWGRDRVVRLRDRRPAIRWLAARLSPIGGAMVFLGGLVLIGAGLLRL